MLFAENTPNNLGVTIYGDYMDFEKLYETLHLVVGDEEEHVEYESARIRVLGVCYDLRHAMMGDRGYEFVPNGLDELKKVRMEVLAPDKNMYLKIQVLWPEMLFVMMALNDFLKIYAKKQSKSSYYSDLFVDTKVVWDPAVAQVRNLQSALAECLKKTLPKASYARLLNSLNGRYVSTFRYISQYIDLLNYKFSNMSPEKRLKSISVFAKRIAERDEDYDSLYNDLKHEANRLNSHIESLRLALEIPDEIKW